MVSLSQSGAALRIDISLPLETGERAAFWWLGQHSFVVRTGKLAFYLDPWLAPWPSRQSAAPLRYDEAASARWALVSHGHDDHLCPETLRGLAAASPEAGFVCPRTEAQRLREEAGIASERLYPLDAGQTIEQNGVRITAIKSKHEFFDRHPDLGFPYLGYVVEAEGITFYHSGDTIPYEGLLTTLQQWPHFDIMFLPINGRDAERFRRNCMGNLTFQEAAELAGELQPSLAVPAHYDMFVGNQEDPDRFVQFLQAKYPETPCHVGLVGERVSLR